MYNGKPCWRFIANRQHGLLPRDLRKLEVGPQAISPSILVRKNSILVNLLHIRALVKADKVLVFDVMSGGDSHAQSIFMWDLEGKLRQGSKAMGGLPYELRYSHVQERR
jgi:magnesium transporter